MGHELAQAAANPPLHTVCFVELPTPLVLCRAVPCVPGWSRSVSVEAFVINIRDAAAPDVEGLVNPLLQRYNAGGCHYSVFGLPAVQVRR
jgi:hypothetical protein